MAALKNIGDIQIFAELYQGATTVVYKGYQSSLERVVLLKVLRLEFSQDERLNQQFQEEARLIARVQHPNVVTVYEYGRFEQWIYFAAEYVEGMTLRELIKIKKLPPELAWFVLLEISKGLKAAHDKKILHKDIKPSNILISNDGQAKITDFGMADLNSSTERDMDGEVKGTIAYFSPEQILGEPINTRSDIFSLGATFFEMLTGVQAFQENNMSEYFHAILNDEPTINLSKHGNIPHELIRICEKMLAKKAAHRYPGCEELIQELEAPELNQIFTVDSADLCRFIKEPVSYNSKIMAPEIQINRADKRLNFRYLYFFSAIVAVFLLSGFLISFFNKNDNSRKTERINSLTDSPQNAPSQNSGQLNSIELSSDSISNKMSPEKKSAQNETLQVKKVDEQPVSKSQFSVKESEDIKENLLMNVGYLQISCKPWAVIYIDGDSIGTTPLKNALELTAGRHEVLLKNPDFPNYSTEIEIANSTVKKIEFSLWSLVGNLKLEVSPWAEVHIDGEYRDTVPPQDRPLILLPGSHLLTLKHPQLGSWETTVEVIAGKSMELKFNLRTLLSK